jgi:hypothetical protein
VCVCVWVVPSWSDAWGYGHIEYTAVVTRDPIDGTESIDACHYHDHVTSRSAGCEWHGANRESMEFSKITRALF